MEMPELRVVVVNESHLDALSELIRANQVEDHPDDPMVADSALEGMRESLRYFDVLSSDCVWFLIAFYHDQPAGRPFSREFPSLMRVWGSSISTNFM